MTVWNVMYEDWQLECCGDRFAVGDEVTWQLLVDATASKREWAAELAVIEGPVESAGGGPVVSSGGVTVPWTGTGAWPPRLHLKGLLKVERHGGKWPRTTGVVRGIQVVSQGYREENLVPGERRLRPVDRCPKRFAHVGRAAAGEKLRREETGVLVALEVVE
ncbi:DUF6578 domain-containing protein [Streptomyces sp. Je 1-369]|uniref:DUF6578 domain-containing protein n=1 Tax=Streptomyces sp. Je 1-369 TaxID=2966192 RepID=UPI0022858254|nr:DUF6578 domain-containing protein [Streptomyces sp. Je 1-369]WAL95162.1 hypothetical protein NOO62_12060 [Streptomyces sp. Je 1-369]